MFLSACPACRDSQALPQYLRVHRLRDGWVPKLPARSAHSMRAHSPATAQRCQCKSSTPSYGLSHNASATRPVAITDKTLSGGSDA